MYKLGPNKEAIQDWICVQKHKLIYKETPYTSQTMAILPILMMEAAKSSEMLTHFHYTTWYTSHTTAIVKRHKLEMENKRYITKHVVIYNHDRHYSSLSM
jgi:hypothetical protein